MTHHVPWYALWTRYADLRCPYPEEWVTGVDLNVKNRAFHRGFDPTQ